MNDVTMNEKSTNETRVNAQSNKNNSKIKLTKTPCPDRQILSVYLDGELESPWKEKLETHLSACPDCRAALAAWQRIGGFAADEDALKAAQARVWEKVSAAYQDAPARRLASTSTYAYSKQDEYGSGTSFWDRSFSIPAPLAAAASLVLVAAFAALLLLRPAQKIAESPEEIAATGTELVPAEFLNDPEYQAKMARFFGDGMSDIVVIPLPEKTFSETGEPIFLTTANYQRADGRR